MHNIPVSENISAIALRRPVGSIAREAREPFWYRWEVVLPLVVALTILASLAGSVAEIRNHFRTR